MKIKLEIYQHIIEHARKEAPVEACGYLAGKNGIITRHYPMKNVDQSTEHFAFDPEQQFAVLKKSREEGYQIIANYHSHPATPARPSEEDISLAFDPDIYYFIVSLAGKGAVVKAFQIKNTNVNEIELCIVD